jgi:hypothetical protein
MRLLSKHPLLDDATMAGAVTVSWARELAGWTGRIDNPELQGEADQILLDAAAAAGADLDDLRIIAQAAYEAWRAQEPDPDEDARTAGQRYHDALQEGCEFLRASCRVGAVPRRLDRGAPRTCARTSRKGSQASRSAAGRRAL